MVEIACQYTLKWSEYINKYLLWVIDRHLYDEDFKSFSTHWYSGEEKKTNSILLLSFDEINMCFFNFWKLIFTESTVKGFNNKSGVFGGSVLLLFWVFCVVCSFFFLFFACLRYVSSTQCCQCLWIFHSWSLLRFSLTFIYPLYKGSGCYYNSIYNNTGTK